MICIFCSFAVIMISVVKRNFHCRYHTTPIVSALSFLADECFYYIVSEPVLESFPLQLRRGFGKKEGEKRGEREEKEENLTLTIPPMTSKFHPCCTVLLILSFSETRHERGPPAIEGFNHNKIHFFLSKNLAQPIVAATPSRLS